MHPKSIVLLLIHLIPLLYAQTVAKTPPMGWNSWNHYHCAGLDESVVKSTASAFISSGLSKAGYQYVNLDDCWQINRTSQGVIEWDTTKFPSGIPSLASYVHSLGLKFGLYTDRGTATCQGRPGSYGYEQKDAQTYASWAVDYVKNDDCNIPSGGNANTDYGKMDDALKATGRPIVHSVKGSEPIGEADTVSNMRRTGSDIQDNWNSMINLVEENNANAKYAHPGFWNDIDMLEVGNGGMTNTEYQTHFSLWCICKAPLILGNDVTNMSSSTVTILTNTDAIAVNQDSLGVQATRVANTSTSNVWAGPLANKDVAVILLNLGTSTMNITATWSEIGLSSTQAASVRDLWQHKVMGNYTGSYTASVVSHGVAFLRMTPV